jgi:hypothetical protein
LNKRLISALIAIFSLIAVSACASSPTLTATPAIQRDKAIELATGECRIPHLVLIGEPQNIHAQLLTLEEADKLTRVEGETINYDIPVDTMVWLVEMDGQLQLVGGPPTLIPTDIHAATSTPPQPFWGTCKVILNANSGTVISTRG